LAGSASLSAIVVTANVAGATPETVTCTTLTGSSTVQTVSGCSGTGVAQTGTHGTATVATKTVKWSTAKTSVEKYTLKIDKGTANTCATKSGYTKYALIIETGSVTGGTATKLVGGAVSADVCVYAKGTALSVVNKGPVKF